MKWNDIEYDLALLHIHPHDGHMSVSLEVTDIPGHEFAFFVIGDNNDSYMVSLNRNDPLEDEKDYPDNIKKEIDDYFANIMSPDQMLDILQDHYNKCIKGTLPYIYDDDIDWIALGKNNIKRPH